MHILLAVDGSPYTHKMLSYVATHHDMFQPGNTYTVVTVNMPVPDNWRAAVGDEMLRQGQARDTEAILNPVLDMLAQQGIQAKALWKLGNPGDVIAQLAQELQADLLVMGSHGHGALANLLMGSVATRVLANCTTPVLLVR